MMVTVRLGYGCASDGAAKAKRPRRLKTTAAMRLMIRSFLVYDFGMKLTLPE
jgi:hypothetical protein